MKLEAHEITMIANLVTMIANLVLVTTCWLFSAFLRAKAKSAEKWAEEYLQKVSPR